MARAREFLERFRPSGTPGAAARPGVPADRLAERSAELEPVFARLAETEADAATIRAAARREADQRRLQGQERAQAVLATGRHQVAADRAELAAQVRHQASVETAAIISAAHDEADAVRTRAGQRLPAMVDRVVSDVRAELAELATAHRFHIPTQDPP